MSDHSDDALISLSEVLSQLTELQERQEGNDPEHWLLAYAILEIIDSAENLEKIVPQLLLAKNNLSELRHLLWDIGSEVRHIDYHIKDSKFLKDEVNSIVDE